MFFEGVEAGLITIERGARFNTLDRPKSKGRWGLLSRSREGGWYNAEYLPQLAAYVDAITVKGLDRHRVLFELPGSALQLDVAILDDDGGVVVLGEAKRDTPMLDKLLEDVVSRFSAAAPGPDSKKRGDEARQLAWRLWTVRPAWLWLIGPGTRHAYKCRFDPLGFAPATVLPTATSLGLDRRLDSFLPPPQLA